MWPNLDLKHSNFGYHFLQFVDGIMHCLIMIDNYSSIICPNEIDFLNPTNELFNITDEQRNKAFGRFASPVSSFYLIYFKEKLNFILFDMHG